MGLFGGIAGAVVGGLTGGRAAKKANERARKAANLQVDGNEDAREQMTDGYAAANSQLDPISALMGDRQGQVTSGYDQMQGALGQGLDTLNAASQPLDVNKFLDPSRDFAMQEAMNAMDSSAAARGNLLSSSATKDLIQYAAGNASQNYNNAANLAMQDRQGQASIGSTLAGIGSAGVSGNNALFNTGVQGVTNQANLTLGEAQMNAELDQSNGNIWAGYNTARQDPTLAAINGAVGGFSQSIGGEAAAMKQLGQITSFYSDENLKENIVELSDDEISDFLNSLNPSEFDYSDKAQDAGAPDGRTAGVMAQDLEKSEIGRNMVTETEKGKKVDTAKSIGAILASLSSINERLEKAEKK